MYQLTSKHVEDSYFPRLIAVTYHECLISTEIGTSHADIDSF